MDDQTLWLIGGIPWVAVAVEGTTNSIAAEVLPGSDIRREQAMQR